MPLCCFHHNLWPYQHLIFTECPSPFAVRTMTVWNDPVCGDGVCTTPFEDPAFGPFGCLADCGPSTAGTSKVVVRLEASYGANSLTTPIMQARSFLIARLEIRLHGFPSALPETNNPSPLHPNPTPHLPPPLNASSFRPSSWSRPGTISASQPLTFMTTLCSAGSRRDRLSRRSVRRSVWI